MKKFKLFTLIALVAISITACSKGSEPKPEPTKKPLPEVSDKSKPQPPVIYAGK